MDTITQIRALSSASDGNYPDIVQASIAAGASADQFFADLITAQNREPVLIASGQQLTAGTVLFQTLTASVAADGGNDGNGVLTVQSVGLDAEIVAYTAVCRTARANAGIFELLDPDENVLARINTGTPFTSEILNLTIADGSSDFVVGDSFTITVAGSASHRAFDFTSDPFPPQSATAVLSADVDTISGAIEQFATARGPAIIPASFIHIPDRPDNMSIAEYNSVILGAVEQLQRRGIVLRGPAPIVVQT